METTLEEKKEVELIVHNIAKSDTVLFYENGEITGKTKTGFYPQRLFWTRIGPFKIATNNEIHPDLINKISEILKTKGIFSNEETKLETFVRFASENKSRLQLISIEDLKMSEWITRTFKQAHISNAYEILELLIRGLKEGIDLDEILMKKLRNFNMKCRENLKPTLAEYKIIP